VLRRWFPQHRFLCAADGGFASHELAGSVQGSAGKVGLVSRFYADAALYNPPPEVQVKANGKRPSAGRPRVRGAKQDTPEQVVAKTPARETLLLSWYGGSERKVEVVSGTGHWYKANQGLVEVRWAFVHDVEGTHRDEYFFSTELSLSAKEIVETYTRRWNLETTFEEMRSYIGLETTRGRKQETVLRVEPCLFGLYSVVACLYQQLPALWTEGVGVKWPGKKEVTFSDAITAVRRWLWVEGVFRQGEDPGAFEKLPQGLQQVILNGLAPAA
jgi:Transposase DDE domain